METGNIYGIIRATIKDDLHLKRATQDKILLKSLKEIDSKFEAGEKEIFHLAYEREIDGLIDFHCTTMILLPSNYYGILRDNILFVRVYHDESDEKTLVKVYNFSEKRQVECEISYLDYPKVEEQLQALSDLIIHSLTNIFNHDIYGDFDYSAGSIHKDVNLFDNASYRSYCENIGLIPKGSEGQKINLYDNKGPNFKKLEAGRITENGEEYIDFGEITDEEIKKIQHTLKTELHNKVVKRDKDLTKSIKETSKRFKKESDVFAKIVDVVVEDELEFKCDTAVSPLAPEYSADGKPSFMVVRTEKVSVLVEEEATEENTEEVQVEAQEKEEVYVTKDRVVSYISDNYIDDGIGEMHNKEENEQLEYLSKILLKNSVSINVNGKHITDIQEIDTDVNLFNNESYNAMKDRYREKEEQAAAELAEAQKLAAEQAAAEKEAQKAVQDEPSVSVSETPEYESYEQPEFTDESLGTSTFVSNLKFDTNWEHSNFDSSRIKADHTSYSVMITSILADEIGNSRTAATKLDHEFDKYLNRIKQFHDKHHDDIEFDVVLDQVVPTSKNIHCRTAFVPGATEDNQKHNAYTGHIKTSEDCNILLVAITQLNSTESQVIVIAPKATATEDLRNRLSSMAPAQKASAIEDLVLRHSTNYFVNYKHIKLIEAAKTVISTSAQNFNTDEETTEA